MVILQWTMCILTLISALISLHLIWGIYRLRSRPDIEPIEVALPELALELNHLVKDIAHAANISMTPALFIRRAALPNAFVVATLFRPELYLTDELLEQCNEVEHGLDKLIHILCHELAHIKRNDSIQLGLLTYVLQWTAYLHLKASHRYAQSKIRDIEQQTDLVAKQIFNKIKFSTIIQTNILQEYFKGVEEM